MRYPLIALVCALLFTRAHALPVPGTSVDIDPPPGFVQADRFPGFMHQASGASIVVTELPGPYAEIAGGLGDPQRLEAQGMVLMGRREVVVDGQPGLLLEAEQAAYGRLFRKWLLAVDRAGSTTLLVAAFPKDDAANEATALERALLAARFGTPLDPLEALQFQVTPVAPFAVAKVIGQTLILSPLGRFPVADEETPFMIIGLSVADTGIPERRAFAEARAKKTRGMRDIVVEGSTPVRIAGLDGYTTTAQGSGEASGTPLTLYQVILFEGMRYSLIQGVSPAAQAAVNRPLFERIAQSFTAR